MKKPRPTGRGFRRSGNVHRTRIDVATEKVIRAISIQLSSFMRQAARGSATYHGAEYADQELALSLTTPGVAGFDHEFDGDQDNFKSCKMNMTCLIIFESSGGLPLLNCVHN
jgi:hypothetical protein